MRTGFTRYIALNVQAGHPEVNSAGIQALLQKIDVVEMPSDDQTQVLFIQNNIQGKRMLCQLAAFIRRSLARIVAAQSRMEKLKCEGAEEARRDSNVAGIMLTHALNDIGFHIMRNERASHFIVRIDTGLASLWGERFGNMEDENGKRPV